MKDAHCIPRLCTTFTYWCRNVLPETILLAQGNVLIPILDADSDPRKTRRVECLVRSNFGKHKILSKVSKVDTLRDNTRDPTPDNIFEGRVCEEVTNYRMDIAFKRYIRLNLQSYFNLKGITADEKHVRYLLQLIILNN